MRAWHCLPLCLLALTRALAEGEVTLSVDGRPVSARAGEFIIPAEAHTFMLGFSSAPGQRLRYRLQEVDEQWREGPGEMFLNVRFADASGEQIQFIGFRTHGVSPGWTGDLQAPVLHRREERLTVPAGAETVWFEFSSAGPPQTLGAMLITDLQLFRRRADGSPEVLVKGPEGREVDLRFPKEPVPRGFITDGPKPKMAQLLTLPARGAEAPKDCLAILDDAVSTHAEWHTIKQAGLRVHAGETLHLHLQQAHSIGFGGAYEQLYLRLPPGKYLFETQPLDLLGRPVGEVAGVWLRVPLPWWQNPWLGLVAASVVLGGVAALVRWLAYRRARGQLASMKEQALVEQERPRIAREIHDTLAQSFTGVIVQLEAAEDAYQRGLLQESAQHVQRARELAGDGLQQARHSVGALRPPSKMERGVAETLRGLMEKMVAGTPLRTSFRVEGSPRMLPPEVERNLLRIGQEALTNALRHAEAKTIAVLMAFEPMRVQLSVQDDGRGFCPAAQHEGFGLAGMKERIEELGGTLTIRSAIDAGTTIVVEVAC